MQHNKNSESSYHTVSNSSKFLGPHLIVLPKLVLTTHNHIKEISTSRDLSAQRAVLTRRMIADDTSALITKMLREHTPVVKGGANA